MDFYMDFYIEYQRHGEAIVGRYLDDSMCGPNVKIPVISGCDSIEISALNKSTVVYEIVFTIEITK